MKKPVQGLLIVSLTMSSLMSIAPSTLLAGPKKTAASTSVKKQNEVLNSSSFKLIRSLGENAAYESWLYKYYGDMIRVGADKSVTDQFTSSPDVMQAVQISVAQLAPTILQSDSDQDANTARTSLLANDELLPIFKDILGVFGYTKKDIDAALVWIAGIGEPNAYTYSALRSMPRMAFYQNLRTMLTKDEKTAVIGHETTHQVKKDVLTGMVMAALFEATGQVLYPNSTPEEAAQKADLMATIRSGSSKLFRQALGLKKGDPHVRTATAGMLAQQSVLARSMAAHMTPAQLARAANALITAIPGKNGQKLPPVFEIEGEKVTNIAAMKTKVDSAMKSRDGEGGDDGEGGGGGDIKAYKQAVMAVTDAQEQGADRGGQIAASLVFAQEEGSFDKGAERGTRAMMSSMMKLAGGPDASNVDAAIQQAEAYLISVKRQGTNLAARDVNDHPPLVNRWMAAYAFSQTDTFKIMTHPFLQAMDMIVKIQTDLTLAKDALSDSTLQTSPIFESVMTTRDLKGLQGRLEDAVIQDVVTEVKNATAVKGETKLENTKAFLKRIDSFWAMDWETPVGDQPLLKKLRKELQAIKDNPVATTLLTELDNRAPVSDSSSGGEFGDLDSALKDAKAGKTTPTPINSCDATAAGGSVAVGD